MLNNTLTTAALGLAVLFPGAFAAVASNGGTAIAAADDTSRVWVEGHYESRELRELVPEQTRRAWVPARHEGVRVPERTGRVYVPPVIRRVRLPGVTERVWVPDETGRRWQHAYLDLDGWHPGHWEDRVVRRGHWEDRVVREGGYEDRVVSEGRWIDKVDTPAATGSRIVQDGYWLETVVVPEHYRVTRKRIWVPGRYEYR